MSLSKLVKSYYKFRKYTTPNAEQALLFFISEVGELCEALRATVGDQFSQETLNVMADIEQTGLLADSLVSGQDAWIRNGDRHKKANPKHEISDVLMMLVRLSLSLGFGDPGTLLIKKMNQKGFYPESDPEKIELRRGENG